MKLTAFESTYRRESNLSGASAAAGTPRTPDEHTTDSNLLSFFEQYGNSSYEKGLYRTHSFNSAEKWSKLLEGYYAEFSGKIKCFAFDWEGNMFAQRINGTESFIMIFEIATGDYFELEQTIEGFHEEDLIDYKDETIHHEKFLLVTARLGIHEVPWDACVGHTVSLLLGGEDIVENMELTNLEVYWSIQHQIMDDLNDIP